MGEKNKNALWSVPFMAVGLLLFLFLCPNTDGNEVQRATLTKSADKKVTHTPPRSAVKSIHFVSQIWHHMDANSVFVPGQSLSCGAYERWYYFPQGVDGPMFNKVQRWDPSQKVKYCVWMENGDGFYSLSPDKNTAKLRTFRCPPLGNFRTLRLPSDSAEFTNFLDQIEGKMDGIDYIRDNKTGLLYGTLDNRFANAQNFSSTVTYNQVDKNILDLPSDTNIVDMRDAAGKRGWTCFRISGSWGSESIQGIGRMPLVYNKLAEHPPALKLNIGNEIKIVDVPGNTYLLSKGDCMFLYPKGNFFKGLARPWMGMHTIETIRRDGAEKRIRFDLSEADANSSDKIVVNFYHEDKKGNAKLSYLININKDIVEKIDLLLKSPDGKTTNGHIVLSYPEESEAINNELEENIKPQKIKSVKKDSTGIRWLIDLVTM